MTTEKQNIKNYNKIWQISDKVEITDKNFVKKYSDYDLVILQLLHNRGIINKQAIDAFFCDDLTELNYSPFLFNDMDKAVKLIIKHIKSQNKIVIYGDYDADGVTSSALLVDVLNILKAKTGVYIPDRVGEGYGLNEKALKNIYNNDAKLVITVDGGIRGKKEVEYAKSIGLDIIITDHHVPSDNKEDYPDCLIINPAMPDENYPYKKLAGVGVAFKLASALIQKSKLTDDDKNKLKNSILDLVAIGTIADCVELKDENRILVKSGLKIINRAQRAGINELIKIAGINNNKKIQAWNIGFQIGPRLNAAGRIDHANTAYNLLVSKDLKELKKIAKELNGKNELRQKITKEIIEKVEKQVNKKDKIIIGICPDEDKAWSEGVVGLVAGRITSKYYRPALVLTKTVDGYKGSGRSIGEFNLIEAIEKCGDELEKFGGHPAACGFSLKKENLKNFCDKIKKITENKLNSVDLFPKIQIERELKIENVDIKLIKKINKFEPFGQKNSKPVFISYKAVISDIIFIGIEGNHIKLLLSNLLSFPPIQAIGFGQAEKWQDLKINDVIDIVYTVDINNFNGNSEAQLKIIDIKCNIVN